MDYIGHNILLKRPLQSLDCMEKKRVGGALFHSTHRGTTYQPSCGRIPVSEHLNTTLRPKIEPSSIAIDETAKQRRSLEFHAGVGVEVAILVVTAREERRPIHQMDNLGWERRRRKGAEEGGKKGGLKYFGGQAANREEPDTTCRHNTAKASSLVVWIDIRS